MKTKSALSYFGSDSEVAPVLASYLDHCNHVTIPFFGGGAILPHLKARTIVANDRHALAMNFYRVLAGRHGYAEAARLIACCENTLSHPSEINRARHRVDSPDRVERAWAYWALCWIGRKGKGGTKHIGGMPSVRRTGSGGNNASRLRAAASDLREWADHFRRCEFENVDFSVQLAKVADHPKCGVYVDAPWVGAGRNYLHEFTEEDHIDLHQALGRFDETAVLVRYGESDFIRELYQDWNLVEAESRTQSNSVKGEIWITNQSLGLRLSA